jgi:NAD(P)-dependent dehydrogenase (short-subunit alcohol dehydrogenase family)
MSAMGLHGKTILVIDGTCAVGREVVLAAAWRGASVVFSGQRGTEAAAAEILDTATVAEMGGRVIFIEADVSSEDDVERLFDRALERLPGLHILVSHTACASVLDSKPLVGTTLADWYAVLAHNLRAPFLLARRAIEEFLGQGEGGRIIHVTYAAAREAAVQASFAAAQTALFAFTRSIAKEYGRREITCNTVLVESESSIVRSGVGCRSRQAARAPRGQAYRPELINAVVEAVLFLGSGEASYVNGEVLRVVRTPPVATDAGAD